MTSLAIVTVLAQIADAGLSLSLAPAGVLAVTPSSHLTADLRDLIRRSKALLIDWLTAANDSVSHAPDSPDVAQGWNEVAAAYHAHHFQCPTCIAAGRGPLYGLRCGVGMALWREYSSS